LARSDYNQTALVLQGGGALGAYQAGVMEALSGHGYEPDWYAGISIGAINSAIMAGNEPTRRLEMLRQFWEETTSELLAPPPSSQSETRSFYNALSAAYVAMDGVPGLFRPRIPPFLFYPRGSPEALSIYASSPLRSTLEKLVDFDRVNARKSRLSLGAVNVRSGNFAYFDNTEQTIRPEHVMASGALPPGLPPIEIDGELYWDGGLVSNTPLTHVLDSGPERDTLIFQVDLFSAAGELPSDIFEAEERRKDIVYSSRTRLNTDIFRATYALRSAIQRCKELVPEEKRDHPDVRAFHTFGETHRVAIVLLIYRKRSWENQAKDYEFSRASMLEHWKKGFDDASITLQNPLWNKQAADDEGVRVFDVTSSYRPPEG
jgi:NTE family protein